MYWEGVLHILVDIKDAPIKGLIYWCHDYSWIFGGGGGGERGRKEMRNRI